MRLHKLVALAFLLTLPAWATGPTYVGGATHQCSSATTCSVTYSPTSGNTVAVCAAFQNTITGVTIQDSGSNALTTGEAILSPTNAGTAEQLSYYVAGSGVTSFTVNWTTARSSSLAVAEYSNVASVNGTPTGGSSGPAGGSTSPTTLSPTASESGDVALVCTALNSTATQSNSVGTIRQQAHTTSPSIGLIDATATGATGTNVQTTFTNQFWNAVGIILKTSVAVTNPPHAKIF